MLDVAAEQGKSVLETKMRLTLERSGYMFGRHIPKIRDVDLVLRFIKVPAEYEKIQ